MNNLKKNIREIAMMTIVMAASVLGGAPLAGTGSVEDPFVVGSVEDLLEFADSVNAGESVYNGKVVVLGADLDLDGVDFPGIGNDEFGFYGIFNGCGHTISNVSVEHLEEDVWGVGFIGCLGNWEDDTAGALSDVRFHNVSVRADDYIGSSSVALVGECVAGILENVTVDGTVTVVGGFEVGGFVGWGGEVVIRGCTIDAEEGSSVTGLCNVGGFIGCVDFDCELADSSVTGLTVFGTNDFDGLVGITYCDEIRGGNAAFDGAVVKHYHENDLADAREIADILVEEGLDCEGFADENLDLGRFLDWFDNCGIRMFSEAFSAPHLFEAYAFDLPFDTFAGEGNEPSMGVKYLSDRPSEGWTTIVLCIKAGDRELTVNDINANVFVKHGDTPVVAEMEEVRIAADRIVPFVCDGGHATVAIEVAPPAGSRHFFKVCVR